MHHAPCKCTSRVRVRVQVGVFGPMESVRIEHDKGEAFVAFLDAQAAAMLLQARPTTL